MCVKLIFFFDNEIKVYYVTQVLKQGINIKTNCPHYILEFKHKKSQLLQVYLGAWAKIKTVIENHVYLIVGHCYYMYSFQALS